MSKTKVTDSNQEKLLVISVDFDGCMGHTLFTNNYKEMMRNSPGKSPEEMKEAYKQVLLQSNSALIADIVRRSEGFDRVVIMVGSNRQSANKDQHDAVKNENGSCFKATEMLQEVLKDEMIGKLVDMDTYLVFDSILGVQTGTNFALTEKQPKTEIFSQYEMSMDKKYRLAFFQMQEVCSRYPNAEVSYVHYDDRNDIVNDTAMAFQSETGKNLPPNMRNATACHYELYNPVASMQSLSNASKKENEENPNMIVGKENLDELINSLDSVSSDCDFLNFVVQKYQDEIHKVEDELIQLNAQKSSLSKGGDGYKQISSRILLLENSLNEIKKPFLLLKEIKAIREDCIKLNGGNLDESRLTWSQFDSLAKRANKLFNSNIRENNMSAFPQLQGQYSKEVKGSRKEQLKDYGQFNRTTEKSHQIDKSNFHSVVKECMQDSYIDRSNNFNSLHKEAFMQEMKGDKSKLNERNLSDFLALYPDSLDKLELIKDLFVRIRNESYAKPRATQIFRRLLAPESSTVRNSHIQILQKACLEVLAVHKNGVGASQKKPMDDSQIKGLMELLDYDTRLITFDPTTRGAMAAIDTFKDSPQTAIRMLFAITPVDQSPFNAYSVADIIGKRLYNPAKKLSKIDISEIVNYMIAHPEHAHFFLEPKSRFLGGRDFLGQIASDQNLIQRMINEGGVKLIDIISSSTLLSHKGISESRKAGISVDMDLRRREILEKEVDDLIRNPSSAKKKFEEKRFVSDLLNSSNLDLCKKLILADGTKNEMYKALKGNKDIAGKLFEGGDRSFIIGMNDSVANDLSSQYRVLFKTLKSQEDMQRIFSKDDNDIKKAKSNEFEYYYSNYNKVLKNKDIYDQIPGLKEVCAQFIEIHEENKALFKIHYSNKLQEKIINLIENYPNNEIRKICRDSTVSAQDKIINLMDKYRINPDSNDKFDQLIKRILLELITLDSLPDNDAQWKAVHDGMLMDREYFVMAKLFELDNTIDVDRLGKQIRRVDEYARVQLFIKNQRQAEDVQKDQLHGLLADDKSKMESAQMVDEHSNDSKQGSRYTDKNSDRCDRDSNISLQELSPPEREQIMAKAISKTRSKVHADLGRAPPASAGVGDTMDARSGAALILSGVTIKAAQDTAANVVSEKTAVFTTANLGDSSAYYLVRDIKTGLVLRGARLNDHLHSPLDASENARLYSIGTPLEPSKDGVRVPLEGSGKTALSAGFGITAGDAHMRRDADITTKEITFNPETEELIRVLACDGFSEGVSGNHSDVDFDYLSHLVNKYSQEKLKDTTLAQYLVQNAQKDLQVGDNSLKKGTTDDTTVMVDNLSNLSSKECRVACLVDGNGEYGDKVAETTLSSVLVQSKLLTKEMLDEKKLKAIEDAAKEGRDVKDLLSHVSLKTDGAKNAFRLMEFAAQTGDVNLAKAILNKGIPIDARNKDGKTVLMIAVEYGSVEIAKTLLHKGARIDSKDNTDQTPLYKAVLAGNKDMVKCLVDNGANPSASCKHWYNGSLGHAPLILAGEKKDKKEENQTEILGILNKAQDKPHSKVSHRWVRAEPSTTKPGVPTTVSPTPDASEGRPRSISRKE